MEIRGHNKFLAFDYRLTFVRILPGWWEHKHLTLTGCDNMFLRQLEDGVATIEVVIEIEEEGEEPLG